LSLGLPVSVILSGIEKGQTSFSDFKAEAYIILAVLFYVAFYWWGSSLNSARVKKW
jgi:hypothetical protein